ncbi:hypothetical protein Lser_V15G17329 [Lactuca serriola]
MGSIPRLEDIPEVIHNIQSRLPVKEAARTSILSKSWLHAWSTIPILRFREAVTSLTEEQETEHVKVIDHTLIRYLHDNIPIQSINLKINIENQDSASLAEKWIRPVASKSSLYELSLTFVVASASFTLPDNILSVLIILSLVKIKLLHCKGFNTIKVKNLSYLYTLRIISDEGNTTFLEINHVPNLRKCSFDLRFQSPPANPLPFNAHSLSLGSNLTQLYLRVDMPRFVFFPATDNSRIRQIVLALSLSNPLQVSFFVKMRKAFKLAMKCDIKIKTKNISVINLPFDNNVNLRKMVGFPAKNVQQLSFFTIGDEGLWERSQIFDAFFTICHPKKVVVTVDNNHFFKVMLSEVIEKKKNTKEVREDLHWCDYLKDFEIETHEEGETLPKSSLDGLARVSVFKLNWR